MIKGIHGLFYTPEAEATREFIRDKLGLDHVDAGRGWLIFGTPTGGELGVHPSEEPKHGLSFFCDDIEQTVRELESKGVTFKRGIEDEGFGLTTVFDLPGGLEVKLYEPRHPQPRVPGESPNTR